MSYLRRLRSLEQRCDQLPTGVPTEVQVEAARHRGLARLCAERLTELPARGAPPEGVEIWRRLGHAARRAAGAWHETPELAASDEDVLRRWNDAHPFPRLPAGCALGDDTPELEEWRARRLLAYLERYLEEYGQNV